MNSLTVYEDMHGKGRHYAAVIAQLSHPQREHGLLPLRSSIRLQSRAGTDITMHASKQLVRSLMPGRLKDSLHNLESCEHAETRHRQTWMPEKKGLHGKSIPDADPAHCEACQRLCFVDLVHLAIVKGKEGLLSSKRGRRSRPDLFPGCTCQV